MHVFYGIFYSVVRIPIQSGQDQTLRDCLEFVAQLQLSFFFSTKARDRPIDMLERITTMFSGFHVLSKGPEQ